ncbi:MAG TPA: hypothetical protein VG347_01565 [Verrucomicrobiae bacterium]|nr:hypothetical protein [Verrucomicrobiae bacterium]
MKIPKFITCLAFILIGSFFGCSTVPRDSLHNYSEGKLFTDQEAIAFKGASSRPWRLKYAVTRDHGDDAEFFATVHQQDKMYAASIYARFGDRLRLLKRLTAGTDGDDRNSSFLEPNFFWTTPKNDSWQKLIRIPELFAGTGHLIEEHIFVIDQGTTRNGIRDIPKLEEVEFIPAWTSFQEHLEGNVGLQGEYNTFTEDGLNFVFAFWKEENGTISVAGKVAGTYKLERKPDGGWRISMDTFKREPFTDDDWHARGLRSSTQ